MGLEEFLKALEGTLKDRVYTSSDALDKYSRDWWPLAMLLEKLKLWKARPRAVLFPETVNEVSLIVKEASKNKVCIVIHGGGSSVTGASSPRDGCVVVSLSRMRKIIDFNEEDLTVTVEPGILIYELEEWLNSKGYTLRHVPQSYHIASIGGCIATLSTGQYSTGYGGIEDMVLNLEVVLPSGEVIWTRSMTVPRSSMGPDLKHLFIGSEGAFGIITKATLRIMPMPRFSVSSAFEVPDFIRGIKLVRSLIVNRLKPDLARLYDEVESMLRFGTGRPILLLSYEGYDDEVLNLTWRKAVKIVEEEGGSNVGEGPFNKWIQTRFNYQEEIERLESLGMWFETIDISATWSRIPELYRGLKRRIESLGRSIIMMTHASHFYVNGAALYNTVVYEKDPEVYWRIVEAMFNTALEHGASISHHHGVGILRSEWISKDPGPASRILAELKKALDPHGTLTTSIAPHRSAQA